ncbi:MAG: ABC transporter permease [Anaerolineaceae bacterium]|nr:ABC transporter permease [Anaerolineaceae bacterium]
MSEQVFHRQLSTEPKTRRIVMGILFLLLAMIVWLFFMNGVDGDIISTFGLTRGNVAVEIPPWQVHSRQVLSIIAIMAAVAGGYQIARGFKKWTNWVLAIVVALFVFGFLVWATADKSLNLAGLLATTLNKAVPITLGALSGVLCERAGVVNIAIEGMMLSGAFVSAYVGSVARIHIANEAVGLWLALASAVFIGGLMGLLLGVLSIKYKANQIIAGTVINILATGLTSYLSAKFLQTYQELNNPAIFKSTPIPGLVDIPVIGPILFNNNMFVYALIFFLILIQVVLFKTKWGLRLRSVGEHPKAADTLGINVFRTRYTAVILGGMMAGFGGAYFTLGSVGRFDEVMTAGRGFIGLAAMIFGNWTPFGSFGAGLLFGFADSLASRIAILQINIPSEFLLMAPYVATMIVLAGVVGKGQMPAADGEPYEKE